MRRNRLLDANCLIHICDFANELRASETVLVTSRTAKFPAGFGAAVFSRLLVVHTSTFGYRVDSADVKKTQRVLVHNIFIFGMGDKFLKLIKIILIN